MGKGLVKGLRPAPGSTDETVKEHYMSRDIQDFVAKNKDEESGEQEAHTPVRDVYVYIYIYIYICICI
jgi:hypothetical protein